MDTNRFDRLAIAVSRHVSRRTVLHGLGAVVAGVVAAALGHEETEAAPYSIPLGGACYRDKQCFSDFIPTRRQQMQQLQVVHCATTASPTMVPSTAAATTAAPATLMSNVAARAVACVISVALSSPNVTAGTTPFAVELVALGIHPAVIEEKRSWGQPSLRFSFFCTMAVASPPAIAWAANAGCPDLAERRGAAAALLSVGNQRWLEVETLRRKLDGSELVARRVAERGVNVDAIAANIRLEIASRGVAVNDLLAPIVVRVEEHVSNPDQVVRVGLPRGLAGLGPA